MSTPPADQFTKHFTPYELGIVLHYYARCDEHDKSPIFDATVDRLMNLGLMWFDAEKTPRYGLTDCGKAFVELGLLCTHIPEQHWVMPAAESRP